MGAALAPFPMPAQLNRENRESPLLKPRCPCSLSGGDCFFLEVSFLETSFFEAFPALRVWSGMGGGFAYFLREFLYVFAEAVQAGFGEVLAAGGLEPLFLGAVDFA